MRRYLPVDGPSFNLQSLSLQNLSVNPERLENIAQILSNQPNLKHFSISTIHGQVGSHGLEDLCDRFSSLKVPPLRLVSLKLGCGFQLLRPQLVTNDLDKYTATYLQQLTDLQCLKHLAFTDRSPPLEIFASNTLDLTMLPNLRHLVSYSILDLSRSDSHIVFHSMLKPNPKNQAAMENLMISFPNTLEIIDVYLLFSCYRHWTGGLISFADRPKDFEKLYHSRRLPINAIDLPQTRLFGTTV